MPSQGIVWDGNALWVGSVTSSEDPDGNTHRSRTLQRISKTDGSVLSSQIFSNSNERAIQDGLAWDGQYLWFSDSEEKTIQRLDPSDLTVLDSFASPAADPGGLTWDGRSLWGVDTSDSTVFQMDTTGNLLGRWSTPGTMPFGITFDGEHLWVVDNVRRSIDQLAIPEPSTLVMVFTAIFGVGVFCVVKRRHADGSDLVSASSDS